MSTDEHTQDVTPAKPKPTKKLKPARKQVKAGDVEKKETVQTGKEYSQSFHHVRVRVPNKVQTSGTTNGLVETARTTTQSEPPPGLPYLGLTMSQQSKVTNAV
jgi:hypothetical protein